MHFPPSSSLHLTSLHNKPSSLLLLFIWFPLLSANDNVNYSQNIVCFKNMIDKYSLTTRENIANIEQAKLITFPILFSCTKYLI